MQRPDSELPKERIGVASVPRADFLIAEAGMVYLLSHDMLDDRKRSKENARYHERDSVQGHNS